MPHFHYQGRNKDGDLIQGIIEAQSDSKVSQHLTRLDIIPVHIKQTSKQTTIYDIPKWLPFWSLTTQDLSMFAKQMHSLLKGGVPINQALQVVAQSNQNALLNNAITNIILDLESGCRLARCFEKQGYIFPDFFSAMIDVGENTGQLDAVFGQIHQYLEMDMITKKRIRGALRYPMIVLCAIAFALIMINFFVVPAFKGFFDSMGATLPLPTRILIVTSELCLQYWWLGVLGLGFLACTCVLLLRQSRYKMMWDQFKLRIPIVGSIIHRAILARFCRSLSMALQSGLPLMEAILVVAKASDNEYMAKKISNMTHGLQNGEHLSQTAKSAKVFSPLTIQMLMVAEETGNMDENLLEIAHFYEQDVDYDIKRLNDLLEPVLIAIIAVMVLILALGVFLPLWDLSAVAMQKVRT